MTVFADLRELAQHIDPQFHPSLNELPALFAALVVRTEHGDELLKAIEAGQQKQAELHPSQISGSEVRASTAKVIQPEAGGDAQVVQGVPQEHYDALQAQVDELRRRLDQSAPAPAPPAGQETYVPSAQEQALQAELDQLRAQETQRAAVADATAQHPTASSEPVPAPDPAVPANLEEQSQASTGESGTGTPAS